MSIFRRRKRELVTVTRQWVEAKHFKCPVHGDIGDATIGLASPKYFSGEHNYCIPCWHDWFERNIPRVTEGDSHE